ncbi:MAG: hypothetical protein IPH13_15380 [Planctomycetes bacterium]|nr:hypothetical protein [Planctomycetota bacterium]
MPPLQLFDAPLVQLFFAPDVHVFDLSPVQVLPPVPVQLLLAPCEHALGMAVVQLFGVAVLQLFVCVTPHVPAITSTPPPELARAVTPLIAIVAAAIAPIASRNASRRFNPPRAQSPPRRRTRGSVGM